ncbi:MAG: divalent-cation tolerance protein CutA [Verrucomicrobiota bacterium]
MAEHPESLEAFEPRLALTTIGTEAEAAQLARALVEHGLAACVNIVPGARSVYRWQGEIHDEAECLLVIKTGTAQAEALIQAFRELHPYDCPELVLLCPEQVEQNYLKWWHGQMKP